MASNQHPTAQRATPPSLRPAVAAMYAGLVLTVAATVVPFVERNVLADHVRSGYPEYSDGRVSSSTNAYLIYLAAVGALGVAAWLWSIRSTRKPGRGALIVTTTAFVLGSGIALTNLFVNESNGDRALPTSLGAVGLAPVLPGLVAVAMVWKATAPQVFTRRVQPRATADRRRHSHV
jgi:hypothetical protein